MRLVALTGVILLAAVLPHRVLAQDALSLESRFQAANSCYFQGEYQDAIAGYDALVEAGVDDADVYFNLASAHAESGEYGRAVGYFERALALDPSDEPSQRGLSAAHDVLARRHARQHDDVIFDTGPPFAEALVRPFSEAWLSYGLLFFSLLLCVGLGLFFFIRRRDVNRGTRKPRLGFIFALLVLVLLAGTTAAGVLIENGWFTEGTAAVVVNIEGGLREGPDPRAAERAVLYEGERARIMASDGEFRRIRVSGDRRGWVRMDQVLSIRPER